jgi:hypothetical protein
MTTAPPSPEVTQPAAAQARHVSRSARGTARSGWPAPASREAARTLLRSGELSWSGDATVTLYDDDVVTVVGNPRRSFGYLYVGAWFKADLPPTGPASS